MPDRDSPSPDQRTALARLIHRPLADRSVAGFVLYRLRYPLLLLVLLFVVSTLGYMLIEHFGVLDAEFMTVITLSTVGYGEVHRLNRSGVIFTTAVIIASFAGLVYAAATLTDLFTSGAASSHLKNARGRRMRQSLQDHVIVIGFGRVGQAVARGVIELGRQCLVIERAEARQRAIEEAGCVCLIGDATDEGDLLKAGIDRAAALVAATEEDATNLVITLTARAVQPGLRLVSRVNESDWQDRIVRAGANVAQSPYPSYGLSLAVSAIGSSSVMLHTLPTLGLATEEIAIDTTSPLVGLTIPQVTALHAGVLIVGLRRGQGFRRWDEVDGAISPGDVVIALGEPERMRELAGLS